MYSTRLSIDTTVGGNAQAGPSSGQIHSRLTPASTRSNGSPFASNAASRPPTRHRSSSNASTSSSLSIISPATSSSNGSMDDALDSPTMDETVRISKERVLAMHDFAPQQQNATCLSFRAGQVIHVLNRDSSGWWDGELDGRRGWFPSNYVNADVGSLTDEELPKSAKKPTAHSQTASVASVASWASSPVGGFHRDRSEADAMVSEIDSYCPPLMIPLLHGLSLLQSAVRAGRTSHYQPSTACIISCVRSILSATDCLPRESLLLQQFPVLFQERKKILSVLAALVAQAKKASEESSGEAQQEAEVETMLKLGGQVFAHVRRFLAVAVQCGVDLPERKGSPEESGYASTDTEGQGWSQDEQEVALVAFQRDPHQGGGGGKGSRKRETTARPNSSSLRIAKSLGDLRHQKPPIQSSENDRPPIPAPRPHPTGPTPGPTHRPSVMSVSSMSSSSSLSSLETKGSPAIPAFPSGPTPTAQVVEALRNTHDHYLSTIAAFIGHSHSYSRLSHASTTGYMYELVREVVEMVCKLLTIVEAVTRHPDVPAQKLQNLRSAKEGLYNVTNGLEESVKMLTLPLPPSMTEEDEKSGLLRSAMGALKAGADCVAAVKMCLNRAHGERPFIIHLPQVGSPGPAPFTPSKFTRRPVSKSPSASALNALYRFSGADEEDLTIQAQTCSPDLTVTHEREPSSDGSDGSSSRNTHDTRATSPEPSNSVSLRPIHTALSRLTPDLASPTSTANTADDATAWEGSVRSLDPRTMENKLVRGELPALPTVDYWGEEGSQAGWLVGHDYSVEDVAYNNDGHLVGATLEVLVEKMTPHAGMVDSAFSAVFFLTFRMFSTPIELVEAIITRYNLLPPPNLLPEELEMWQKQKGIPVRLRVSNFIKMWVEMYWRAATDEVALSHLTAFTREGLAMFFPGPSQRILGLLELRRTAVETGINPRGDRIRDPGMSINPPVSAAVSEIPRPTMTKTLLAALRSKSFASIVVTDFDTLELARQLTIMECNLYCAIQPEEILETGQEGAKHPTNVRAVSTLSTTITGWVAESILNEHDIKKRTTLVKFFIKLSDRCLSLHNYSTSRSILAALDSSTISRLHQTWLGLAQKHRLQLEVHRRLADHSRNYHEYRTKLRNTAPPAVPFLGLYLTDVTFCREGNPSHRAAPLAPGKKLLNFNKYHKLARIVQDMQRFQEPYNLKAIPEVQQYLNSLFQKSKHLNGDLQDLYRRSLLVEPKQLAGDTPPASASDMRQLFSWATRSQQTAV